MSSQSSITNYFSSNHDQKRSKSGRKEHASAKDKLRDKCVVLYKRYQEIIKHMCVENERFNDLPVIRKDNAVVDSEWIFGFLITELKLADTDVSKMINKLRRSENLDFLLHRVQVDPLRFVQTPEMLLRFETATQIMESYELRFDPTYFRTSWLYDKLLFEYRRFYVPKFVVEKQFQKDFSEDVDVKTFASVVRFSDTSTEYVTIPEFQNREIRLGDTVMNLLEENEAVYTANQDLRDKINEYATTNLNLSLTSMQSLAVCHALEQRMTIICGHPGTGKTTIVDCMLAHLPANNKCLLLTPTGMALNNLVSRCSKYERTRFATIHRMLYEPQFFEDFRPSYVIVDESSMIDFYLFEEIARVCRMYDAKLVLLGDMDQLPPIGAGTPVNSIIQSGYASVFRLKVLKRQSKGALRNTIKKMSTGGCPSLADFDQESLCFEPFERFDKDVVQRVVRCHGLDMNTTRFVTPQHKYAGGTEEINRILQKLFLPMNAIPFFPSYKVTTPMYDGDLVVRTVNDYRPESLFANGDIGYVRTSNELGLCNVHYLNSDKIDKVFINDLYREFSLAYCLTVHKVQGSQYDNIVVLMSPEHQMWKNNDSRAMLYTAISRAKHKCVIVGDRETFKTARTPSTSTLKERFMHDFSEEL
jgi:energy-coupling factor transporter ATP-binding protein EcfA2